MAGRKLKILVACGSGICTSTVAAQITREVCDEYGIEADITNCTLFEIPTTHEGFDIVLTANRYQGQISTPMMNVFSFVTGIGEEKTRRQLGEKLRELSQNL
jgi:PTS system galactitol-specific IIB component